MLVIISVCILSFLRIAHARTAIANFYNGGITGRVTFVQQTAEDVVEITVNFSDLDGQAAGYHIHELPVNYGGSGFKVNSFDIGCGADITAGHFNPLNVQGGANNNDGPYLCSPDNQAACEAGDISGKFGSLAGLPLYEATLLDGESGLTLFGRDSIIGRSMVVHRPNGSRLICGNIFEAQGNSTIAYSQSVATFDREPSGVQGTVTVATEENSGRQFLFANLELGPDFPGNEATLEWTVNIFPVLAITEENKFERCSQTSLGEVAFNIGDSLEPIELKKGQRTKILRTITDESIDLSGKSLLFTSGRTIVDCTEFGKTAVAQFIAEEQNGVTGSFLFRQTTKDDVVTVTLTLDGLNSRANGYHVHTLPVFEDCGSTTGHFNPLDVEGGDGQTGEYLCDKFNPALCESGDLSNRFGGLLGRNSVEFSFSDTGAGLQLFGRNSIVGRSVVVHRIDGSRLACANIREFGELIRSEAIFSEEVNSVKGKVSMFQRAVDPDADTTFVFDISRVDAASTTDHMFHIHETPVSDSNDCAETQGHFSPSGINGGAGQSGDYLCDENDQDFCEVGDISGKQSLADLPNRVVFTDFSVPLSGVFSIEGRSITFHDEDGASGRIDCANLNSLSIGTPDLSTGGDEPPVSTQSPTFDDDSADESDDDSNNAALITFLLIFAIIAAVLSVYVGMTRWKGLQSEDNASDDIKRSTQEVVDATL